MKTKVTHARADYDGSQLSEGWAAKFAGLEPGAEGGVAIAFRGACDVSPEHMIDLEDLEAGETIVARDMLHFIVEHPGCGIDLIVVRQRIMVALACEVLSARGVEGIRRSGDDIFIDPPAPGAPPRKMSVSIATTSASGAGLIHLGLNVDPAGAPVPAVGLAEFGVDPARFAADLLARYAEELRDIAHAATKVRQAN